MSSENGGVGITFNEKPFTPTARKIVPKEFSDLVPDIITMDIEPPEYLVPALGIPRNSIALWTATDGVGKTFLAEAMAIAVSRGDFFLGMRCRQASVLYIDLENPNFEVQTRIHKMREVTANPNLRVWGTWCLEQPPQAGSDYLLEVAEKFQPLIVIDPLRYFHGGDENDSSIMSGVMQYLRACAVYGCAVVLLHHPAKTEGSTGRGSGAIRGACDLAFLHKLKPDTDLITLTIDKNRFGARRTFTIRADFENGTFETTDSPYVTQQNTDTANLSAIITQTPGLSQNAITKQSGMQRKRCVDLLRQGNGIHWREKDGSSMRSPVLYYPLFPNSGISGNNGNNQGVFACSLVPSSLEGTRNNPLQPCSHEQRTSNPKTNGKTLPSCPFCGGFALYPESDGRVSCQSCGKTSAASGNHSEVQTPEPCAISAVRQ